MAKASLATAKRDKKDEFYTRLEDISNEIYHYRHHFQGKSVFLNCDDPETSNFWRYFELNFDDLGLTRLVSTHYHPTERTYKLVMERNGDGNIITTKTPLEGNGDFRSAECIALLDEADIITTNPPFSLFREYLAQLVEHNKHFLILGHTNAVSYKEVFPLIKEGKIWAGYSFNKTMEFAMPETYVSKTGERDELGRKIGKVPGISWYTNLDIDKRHEPLTLWKDYVPDEYPQYDNFDAIEVGKVADIPVDYYGIMGVPITFLDRFCPEQFEIVGITQSWYGIATKIYPKQIQVNKNGKTSAVTKLNDGPAIRVNSKPTNKTYYIVDNNIYIKMYARILIRRVDQPNTTD